MEMSERARNLALWIADDGMSEGLVRTIKDKILEALQAVKKETIHQCADEARRFLSPLVGFEVGSGAGETIHEAIRKLGEA